MPATLETIIRLRDELTGPLRKAQSALGLTGKSMTDVGKIALGTAIGFHGVQAAVQGVGQVIKSSIAAAAAYEAQWAQIRALTGATKSDTDFLSDSIKEMTKTLPKSPQELGAAAYFILSSGITDAAEAAEVLEIAAKASAVGLGDTQTVADALTTVINAYGEGTYSAAGATDILMQAVKDGKVEASGFANVLGTVVPLAATMGISFEEVAANLATFTRLGVSAEEAATGLRGVMNQLLSPSKEARDLLLQVGLSADSLRAQIREKGLLIVLQGLLEKFKGNQEALGTLFPEVRGLTNVLATAGVQLETYTDILGRTQNATGNLEEGFADVSQTAQFKMKKAMNDLNVAMMELGAEGLPAIVAGLEALPPVLDFVGDSLKPVVEAQKAWNKEVEMAMFDGPKLVATFKDHQKGLEESGVSARNAALELGFMAAGHKINQDVLRKFLAVLGLSNEEVSIAVTEYLRATGALGDYSLAVNTATVLQNELRASGADLAGVVGATGLEVETVTSNLETMGDAATDADTKVSDLFKDFQKGARDAIEEILPMAGEFDELADSTKANADAQKDWNERVAGLGESLADAEKDLADAQQSWSVNLAEMGEDLANLEAQLAVATEPEDVERLTDKIGDLHRKMGEGGPDIDGMTGKISDLREEMGKAPDTTPIISGFDAWRDRVHLLADDYANMKTNMQMIMDALVDQHVVGVGEIMAVIQAQGPEFAADFAQWFRDDPIAAAQTVKEIMPGIMGEAAREAIANVLTAVSLFNEKWQTDVIGALNALPEEKRVNITATVDPQFWLLIADLERQFAEMGGIFIAPGADPAGFAHAQGGVVTTPFQLVGEEGPEIAALPMGTRIFPADQTAAMLSASLGATPSPALTSGASGGTTYNISIGNVIANNPEDFIRQLRRYGAS